MLIWVLNKKKQECEYPQNICLLVWKDMCLSGNGKHPSHETASVSECLFGLQFHLMDCLEFVLVEIQLATPALNYFMYGQRTERHLESSNFMSNQFCHQRDTSDFLRAPT